LLCIPRALPAAPPLCGPPAARRGPAGAPAIAVLALPPPPPQV